MKFKLQDMIAEGIRYYIVDNNTLLYLEDVKKNYPETKVHSANIITLPINDIETKLVRVEDIEEMTEFDKAIVKTLNFNPNKNTL